VTHSSQILAVVAQVRERSSRANLGRCRRAVRPRDKVFPTLVRVFVFV